MSLENGFIIKILSILEKKITIEFRICKTNHREAG